MGNLQTIENLGLEAEQLAAMSQAIEDAIEYGPFTEKTYHGALSLLTNLLEQHADKINFLVERTCKGWEGKK